MVVSFWPLCFVCLYLFTPNHLVDYSYVRLDDLDYFGGYGVGVVGDWDAIVAVFVHLYCEINTLEETFSVNT